MAGYYPRDTDRSPRPAAHLRDLDEISPRSRRDLDELDLVRLIPNPNPYPNPNPNPLSLSLSLTLTLTLALTLALTPQP